MYKSNIKLTTVDRAKAFVDVCMQYPFDIELVSGKYVVNAKSIMGVLSVTLSSNMEVQAESDDVSDFPEKIKEFTE